MRTIRRLLVVGVLALALGATLGLIVDDIKHIATPEIGAPLDREGVRKLIERFENEAEQVTCLANIIQTEAGGERVGNRMLVAMIAKARKDDSTKLWGGDFCTLAKKREFNGVDNPREENHLRKDNIEIAQFIVRDQWDKQVLPRGWGCVRYYALAEEIVAKLSPKQKKKLGISKEMKGYAFFREKLRPVARFGRHVAYEPKDGCTNPHPTT